VTAVDQGVAAAALATAEGPAHWTRCNSGKGPHAQVSTGTEEQRPEEAQVSSNTAVFEAALQMYTWIQGRETRERNRLMLQPVDNYSLRS
jgi:hypothetical protein